MASPQLVLVLDSTDPAALAEFWATALGYRRQGAVEQYEVLVPQNGDEGGMTLLIQGVAEPKRGKNRMHLDLHVPDVVSEVERLSALGATREGEGSIGALTWVRMADPEGNEFDLAPV